MWLLPRIGSPKLTADPHALRNGDRVDSQCADCVTWDRLSAAAVSRIASPRWDGARTRSLRAASRLHDTLRASILALTLSFSRDHALRLLLGNARPPFCDDLTPYYFVKRGA